MCHEVQLVVTKQNTQYEAKHDLILLKFYLHIVIKTSFCQMHIHVQMSLILLFSFYSLVKIIINYLFTNLLIIVCFNSKQCQA